ncbi:phosphoribosylformylglycinamidine synthase, partial [bacterium AH-315-J04]|nr:phosphoribosylformylglycinamidine synthase [bacterium AH-315-J04]
KAPRPGDKIVVAGGRTGRDGIHGATFSSAELTDTHADEFSHAVQIGNAIEEKKLLDAQLLARDHADGCLYSSVTDCGAGGLSSAVGEMGEQTGADVELKNVPLKYSGLRYDEIWISEAQERMVYSVPPENIEKFLALFAQEDVEATVIGDFTDDKKLRVKYDDTIVCELDMAFLHDGLPKTIRKASWTGPEPRASARADSISQSKSQKDISQNDRLLAALSEWSTASKEWVIRQYDHEVQGRSVIKPLAGPLSGPSDAAVLRPIYTSKQGIALGCGLCPQLGDDPYWMAIYAIDEALRNIICVGANPNRTAILDNFCWPKVDTEHSMGTLVRACRGAYDAAMVYGLPFISGKDSLNNEFTMSDAEAARTGLPKSIAIPPTLLISALGIVDDTARCITMDLKSAENVIAIASADIRQNDLDSAFKLHKKVASLIAEGKIVAAHDVSDGGLAVALAEMCIASGLGITADVSTEHYAHELFDEPSTTYVLEMNEKDANDAGLPIIGQVVTASNLIMTKDKTEVLNLSIDKLAHAWRTPLSQGGGQS